jgi:hypothetical protein
VYTVIKEIIKHDREAVFLKLNALENQQLCWQNDHEFIYKGEYYDVITSDVKGSNSYFYCYKDSGEKKLSSQLEKEMQHPLKLDGKTKQLKAINLLLYSCTANSAITSVYIKLPAVKLIYADAFSNFYISSITTPPPEFS